MTITVYAVQGEALDHLCWRTMRRTAGVVEEALELNPGIALTDRLAEGRAVLLPGTSPQPTRQLVNLWD
ncbi:MAG: tail protein X [Azoarcus sp.]|jgi:phage tail protein X|nr:tail protein X [Azoarcus sp.]